VVDIRRATPDDWPAIIAMGALAHEESPRFSKMVFSPARCHALFNSVLATPTGVAFVATRGDAVLGVLVGLASPHYMSDSLVASEIFFYVHAPHRGGRTASALVDAYTDWAESMGAVDIALGVSSAVDVDRTAAFYERKGFARQGTAHWRSAQKAQSGGTVDHPTQAGPT
jgi:GNAT superfamily N-acetyltransferase